MVVVVAALAAPTAASAADPVADFTINPTNPTTNTRVTFRSTSTDADNDIIQRSWDFNGDGAFEEPNERTVRGFFRVAGVYTITHRVTDATGGSSSVSKTITVTTPPPPPPPPAPPPPPSPPPAPSASAPPTVNVVPAARVAGTVSASFAPRLLAPFPVVRIQGKVIPTGAAIRRFTVKAPGGARVRVVCSGRSCPKRGTLVKRARKATILRFIGIERHLRVGTVIEVFVNRKSRMGKYTRIEIKRNAAPARQDLCVVSMRRSPSSCPSS